MQGVELAAAVHWDGGTVPASSCKGLLQARLVRALRLGIGQRRRHRLATGMLIDFMCVCYSISWLASSSPSHSLAAGPGAQGTSRVQFARWEPQSCHTSRLHLHTNQMQAWVCELSVLFRWAPGAAVVAPTHSLQGGVEQRRPKV